MSLKVKGIQCTGRADYAIGYCGVSGSMLETLFVIIEPKNGTSLAMAKAVSQTLFCLGEPFMCCVLLTECIVPNIAYRYFEK